jgi:hypothetical protein
MGDIVHHRREGFLKALLLAVLFCALALAGAAPARADELVVGALRDQDGAVVAGAAVAALDASGGVLASDRSAPDGTFALSTPTRPAAVLITAADAEPLKVAVPADGRPIGAIVRRHRAADLIPSVADVAALPAGSLSQVGSVLPYRVAFPGSISDRWLAQGRGVTTVEGLPFYRRGDGGDTTSLLPAHSFGAVDVRDPLQAVWYGDRAGGGVVDARLFDRQDAARLTNADGALLLGRNPAVLAAESFDPDGRRRLVAARLAAPLGPLNATFVALVGDGPGVHYAGAGAELHAATQRVDLAARLDLTADDADPAGPARDDGTVAGITLDAAGRGPNAIAVRARWRDERSAFADALGQQRDAAHQDAALVFGTTRGSVARVSAALALAYGDEHANDGTTYGELALLPMLALDAPLGRNWTFHAGAGASSLGTPGYGLARASLGEASIAYADRRRLRAELVAYSEGDTAPTAVNRGFAASLGWEIAPRLSLRAWSLRDADMFDTTVPAYPGGPLKTISLAGPFDRDVVWLTWDAPTRFDVLVRNGALEGGVRVPLGGRYALSVGSYRRRDATRALTFGLVAR